MASEAPKYAELEKWVQYRNGLYSCVAELQSKPCPIAYFGNSVTVQRNGYKEHLHRYICNHFRQNHSLIPAGIGGVGSLACSFFVKDLVIDRHPKLCFIECSVADAGEATPFKYIGRAIEGILRQLSHHGIQACLIYMPRIMGSSSAQGYMQQVIAAYEAVAEHYCAPSINLHGYYQEKASKGDLNLHTVLYDGVHTSDTSSEMTAADIFLLLKYLIQKPAQVADAAHTIIPLHSSPFEFTTIIPVNEWSLHPTKSNTGLYRLSTPYWILKNDEQHMYKSVESEIIGLLLIADEKSGVVEVHYNNKQESWQVHDKWCDKPRLQIVIFEDFISAGTAFSVSASTNRIAPKNANGSASDIEHVGEECKLIGFLASSSSPFKCQWSIFTLASRQKLSL